MFQLWRKCSRLFPCGFGAAHPARAALPGSAVPPQDQIAIAGRRLPALGIKKSGPQSGIIKNLPSSAQLRAPSTHASRVGGPAEAKCKTSTLDSPRKQLPHPVSYRTVTVVICFGPSIIPTADKVLLALLRSTLLSLRFHCVSKSNIKN